MKKCWLYNSKKSQLTKESLMNQKKKKKKKKNYAASSNKNEEGETDGS